MFEKLYKSNKLRNKIVEKICFDLFYVRQYYQRKQLKIYDCSNTTSIKIDLQDSIRIYVNDDNTADICTFGPGLIRDIPFTQVLQTWIIQ